MKLDETKKELKNFSLGDIKEKDLTVLSSGFVESANAIDGVTNYVEFDFSNKADSKILFEQTAFNWVIAELEVDLPAVTNDKGTQIAEKTVKITNAASNFVTASRARIEDNPVGLIDFYTIWDEPQQPWSLTAKAATDSISGQDPFFRNSWVSALSFVTKTAKINDISDVEFMQKLTQYLHTSHGLTYDTTEGATKYLIMSARIDSLKIVIDYTDIMLTDYLKKNSIKSVNCYDQACSLELLSKVFGFKAKSIYQKPFGYIPETILVGNIKTNNPFFNNADKTLCFISNTPNVVDKVKKEAFFTKAEVHFMHTMPLLPKDFIKEVLILNSGMILSIDGWKYHIIVSDFYNARTNFDNHAFVEYDNKIYDSCAGAYGEYDYIGYKNKFIDSGSAPEEIDMASKTGTINNDKDAFKLRKIK